MGEKVELASSPCAANEAILGFAPAAAAVATLVLAGGEGRRMGGGKPQRLLGEQSLLARALDKATGFGGPVALGLRAGGAVEAPADIAIVTDWDGAMGPLASLAAGFDWAARVDAGYLQILPCDAPFVPSDLTAKLANTLRREARLAALPRSFGRLHPACGLWAIGARAFLAPYVATGRAALIGFAQEIGFATVDWPDGGDDPFFNINSPTDLAAAEQRLRDRG